MTTTVEHGRAAFARRAWSEAYTALQAADEPGDLERLATAAHLIGKDDESADIIERAYQAFLAAGDGAGAARCAFWLGMRLMNIGEMARGGGWLARAQRAVGDADCVEQGYMLIPAALQRVEADPAAAHDIFTQALAVAQRFGDTDLTALGRLGQGQSLLLQGQVTEAVALFDEVMVAVDAGEVSAVPAGIVYCAVISACQGISDLRRAQEWTAALSRWCAAQPDLVPFRGQCLIHRSQILQLHGDWSDAMDEARQACDTLASGHPAVGAAHYQRGEVHRLRGEFTEAEEAYREASQWGHNPQPGLAQLRLAQGQTDVARATIDRVLDEVHDAPIRSGLLAACVEISLAAEDVVAARAAADELLQIATQIGTPLLRALADHLTGAVLLVEGDPQSAAASLQRAAATWRDLNAPYEAARARVLVGLAWRQLGDADSADMEFDAARRSLQQLGAAPELSRLERLTTGATHGLNAGLTEREVQVLRLIAAGKSNRAIADELIISAHTVARHVQNIFTKLGVTSRTAAAAFAFERDLL